MHSLSFTISYTYTTGKHNYCSHDIDRQNRCITYDLQIFNNDGVCTHFQDWAGLDPMMSASRFAKLQSLQKMTEMQEFLEFIAKEGQ